jgi:hypothetical protein
MSPSASLSSRQANSPASVVTLLSKNRNFKRLSKPTRKSSLLGSSIGLPCHFGMLIARRPVFLGLAQAACQSEGSQMGDVGLEVFAEALLLDLFDKLSDRFFVVLVGHQRGPGRVHDDAVLQPHRGDKVITG